MRGAASTERKEKKFDPPLHALEGIANHEFRSVKDSLAEMLTLGVKFLELGLALLLHFKRFPDLRDERLGRPKLRS